ncbi:MAG: response regulator [Spirochaetota bacterium]
MNQAAANANVILFVDDEVNILNAIKRELHGWSREHAMEIHTCGSAKEGFAFLENSASRVAVVVSDLRMPEMLGTDFLLGVKRLYPSIISMLLTGFSEAGDHMNAIGNGVFSCLIKPWEPAYLKAELAKAINARRMGESSASQARIDDEESLWAGEMQRAFLKARLLAFEAAELQVSHRPRADLRCGRAYFDLIGLGAGRYLLLVGDVVGKDLGLKEAFAMGMIKAVVHPEYVATHGDQTLSPAALLSWLDGRLDFGLRRDSGLLIKLLAAVLDVPAMTLVYANAGQSRLFKVSSALAKELPKAGIGLSKPIAYEERTEKLGAGDILFACSEGLAETGSAGLADILSSTPYETDYHGRVLESVLAAEGKTDFSADLAIASISFG